MPIANMKIALHYCIALQYAAGAALYLILCLLVSYLMVADSMVKPTKIFSDSTVTLNCLLFRHSKVRAEHVYPSNACPHPWTLWTMTVTWEVILEVNL